MGASFKIILREDARRLDGLAPFVLQVIINRRKKIFTLSQSCRPDAWDKNKGKVLPGYMNAGRLNGWLATLQARASDIIFNADILGKPLTIQYFAQEWEKTTKHNDFFEFADNVITKKNLSDYTRKKYVYLLIKLKKWRGAFALQDIDYKFLQDYYHYCRKVQGNANNTAFKNLSFIRSIVSEALKMELLAANPFLKFSMKWEQSQHIYLTKNEIEIIESLPLAGMEALVLQGFLFGCYTGLRFSDIIKLTAKNINGNVLRFKAQKTNDYLFIPLTNYALAVLAKRDKVGLLFPLPTNQVCNRILKRVCWRAGILKKISFHCGRHTFATLSLNYGISLETVSKLLGHSSLRTTQIYAKMQNNTLVTEMEKWK